AAMARSALQALEQPGRAADVSLRRAAAEAFDRVGDADSLRLVFADAGQLSADDPRLPEAERIARAQFRLRYAGYLAQQGDPDQALAALQAVLMVFEALGDRRSRAVTLGDIARIRRQKGEVDAALQLHQEELQVHEALGDRRARAITLGDIARIMAHKGEV